MRRKRWTIEFILLRLVSRTRNSILALTTMNRQIAVMVENVVYIRRNTSFFEPPTSAASLSIVALPCPLEPMLWYMDISYLASSVQNGCI